MTGRLIHTDQPHTCNPGWTEYTITGSGIPELNGKIGLAPPHISTRDGDVWECECGRTWVAYHPYVNDFSPSFRREGRFERWHRERKQAKETE